MDSMSPRDHVTLPRDVNQAYGIGRYAIDFCCGMHAGPSKVVLERVEAFYRDAMVCGVSALAWQTNAPTVLRREALEYSARDRRQGATCMGSRLRVMPEKAVLANCSAVREWDANGTNFGYDPARGATQGEFGHNDFYPVVVAAAQTAGLDGLQTLRAMVCLDEIRGRLAEVFALRSYKIDHVLHGAIASAAVYGAMVGATPEQIDSAIGLVVAHAVPFRAIRSGQRLSDSKGASAAISAEWAVTSVGRAMRGFVGPTDIFRNGQAIFCLFEPPARSDCSPFDLTLATAGDDFAVMGMHFKLGLYEHQSAGAIHGLLELMASHPGLVDDPTHLEEIRITTYEPAYGIIGDAAKRRPQNRQSADHSMFYIMATLLRKAYEYDCPDWREPQQCWRDLMLLPEDYSEESLHSPLSQTLIDRMVLVHGGADYDRLYPEGIPTSVDVRHTRLGQISSGLVMFPLGHARNSNRQALEELLNAKFSALAGAAVDDVAGLRARLSGWNHKSPADVASIHDFPIRNLPPP
jgi:2-methylcitrate dehydratase